MVLAKAEEGADEVRGLSEAQAALTQPDQVLAVERSVVTWLKQIGECRQCCKREGEAVRGREGRLGDGIC